jgi:hypothetical protein
LPLKSIEQTELKRLWVADIVGEVTNISEGRGCSFIFDGGKTALEARKGEERD